MTGEERYLRAIGRRIRQLRTERGWSQEKLAEKSGLHRTYISTVEKGERNLAALNLRRFARAFGLSVARLFGNIR